MPETTALDKAAEIHEALAGSPLTAAFAEIERAARDADTTHNGWANYPTWAVNLWIENEEPTYRAAREMAQHVRDEASDDELVERGVWTVQNAERYRLADRIKEWVTDDLAPDLGATFAADLLGYALGEVDWDEIASAWLDGLD